MKDNKYRSRVHMLLLYPDNDKHMQALELIKKGYDYASILHDSDYNEDGELKKAHYHVIIRTHNATWNSAICKELGLELNLTEQVRNLDNSLMYLLHFNEPNKYQYDYSLVDGSLKNRLASAINNHNKSEGEKVSELISEIMCSSEKITITSFAQFCAKHGYWSEFRRSATIFLKIIEEHNSKF